MHGDVFPPNGVLDRPLVDDDCPVVYPDIAPRGIPDSAIRPGAVPSPLEMDPAFSKPAELIPTPNPSSSIPKKSDAFIAVGPFTEGRSP